MKKYLLMLLLLLLPIAAYTATAERITIDDLKTWHAAGEKVVYLDTRNDYAWKTSNRILPGAIRVHDNQSFTRVLNRIPTTARIVAYCT